MAGMYEIGASLREARIRDRIDITEVEEKTKIRAKYLRALENEEWSLLPGPTYVKSFLRTYADYLGLDATALVDEYRLRYEKPQDSDRKPLSAGSLGAGREQTKRPPRIPRVLVIVVLCIGLVIVLFVLGSNSDQKKSNSTTTSSVSTDDAAGGKGSSKKAGKDVSLQIVPTGPVWVCLQNANGKHLIDGKTLGVNSASKTFRGNRFRVTLGNGSVELRVNGRLKSVPDRSKAVGYSITSAGRTVLGKSSRPKC